MDIFKRYIGQKKTKSNNANLPKFSETSFLGPYPKKIVLEQAGSKNNPNAIDNHLHL